MEKNKRASVGIMAIMSVCLASSATSPALATIGSAFPESSPAAVASIATLPTLVAVPFTIYAGMVSGRRVRYKTIAVWGLLFTVLGGLFPFFAGTVPEILAGRAILGVGNGLLLPLSAALTLSLFEGEELPKQFSKNAIAMNLGAVFFQLIGGLLCNIGWRMSFLAYISVLPVLFAVIILLPEPEGVRTDEKQRERREWKKIFSKPVLFWSSLQLLHNIGIYTFVTQISGIVSESAVGAAAFASVILALHTGAGAFGSYIFRYVNKLTGIYCCAVGCALSAAAFWIISGTKSNVFLLPASFLFGTGFGMLKPAFEYYMGRTLLPEYRTASVSVYNIFASVGSFSSAFVMQALRHFFRATEERFPFLAAGILYAALLAVILTVGKRTGGSRRKQERQRF